MRNLVVVCTAALALAMPSSGALAQEQPPAGPLILQLNNAETVAEGCQLYFAAQNDSDTAIQRSSFQVAVIDADNRVSQLIVFPFKAFPVGVTKVESLILPQRKCEDVTGLLINEVKECVAADGTTSPVCDEQMEQSSNTTIQFPWRLKR